MDIAVANADIQNTKFAKIFHALAISVQIQKVLQLELCFTS